MSVNTIIVSGYGIQLEFFQKLANSEQTYELLGKLINGDDLFDLVDEYNKKDSEQNPNHIEIFYGITSEDYEFDGDGTYLYVPTIQPYEERAIHTKDELNRALADCLCYCLIRELSTPTQSQVKGIRRDVHRVLTEDSLVIGNVLSVGLA